MKVSTTILLLLVVAEVVAFFSNNGGLFVYLIPVLMIGVFAKFMKSKTGPPGG